MAVSSGTATDYHDLLDRLRIFLTSAPVNWTQIEYTAPVAITDVATMTLRAPGSGTGREIFFRLRTEANVPNGAYGWEFSVSSGDGQPFGSNVRESPSVYFNTSDASINYRFYANDRRVIVIAQIGTVFVSMYAGLFLPLAAPTEYPFPIYVGGSLPFLDTANAILNRNRFLADPGNGCAFYLTRQGSDYRQIGNNDESNVIVVGGKNDLFQPMIWPHRVASVDATFTAFDWSYGAFLEMRPNGNGERFLWQCYIHDYTNNDGQVPGALEGVFALPGFGVTADQLITIGSNNYRAIPNVFRSDEQNFMAIEEV